MINHQSPAAGVSEARSKFHQAAEHLIQLACHSGLTVLTVESCTAGAMAAALADVPGAGDAFHGGFVVYSRRQKMKAVGVPAAVVRKHTAVSASVAKTMAEGGLTQSPADIALATGVAGPEPDEDGNPVGLVFIAGARKGGATIERELSLTGSKDEICKAAMFATLKLGEELIRG